MPNDSDDAGMTSDEQLDRWVEGEPVHREDDDDGECCPDFSCCVPELLAEEDVRRRFVAADEEGRSALLMGFLGAAISKAAEDADAKVPEVYVAGDPANYERGQ